MQSAASLRPFEGLESGYRRRAGRRRGAPERRPVLSRARSPEPRIAVWQTCLLVGGSSLLLWGLIGSVAWHFLG